MRRPKKEDQKIEKAIKYMVFNIHKSGRNPKPVIIHSIRTGINLYNLNYPIDIVNAGILHDIVEDSSVTIRDIEDEFGPYVAKLVAANTHDESITNWVERYEELFNRCFKNGKDAMIVEAADMLDNADYAFFDEKGNPNKKWIKKFKYMMDLASKVINKEKIYKEAENKYREVEKN